MKTEVINITIYLSATNTSLEFNDCEDFLRASTSSGREISFTVVDPVRKIKTKHLFLLGEKDAAYVSSIEKINDGPHDE